MQIGNVKVGSEHRIALQTMTTTDTRNVRATADQVGAFPCSLPWQDTLATAPQALLQAGPRQGARVDVFFDAREMGSCTAACLLPQPCL